MKRTAIIVGFILAVLLGVWHFVMERPARLIILVDGTPATSPLEPLLRDSPSVLPDANGRFAAPANAAKDMYEFKSGPDTNWLLKFPNSGVKTLEISGADLRSTESISYFGVYTQTQTVEQAYRPVNGGVVDE